MASRRVNVPHKGKNRVPPKSFRFKCTECGEPFAPAAWNQKTCSTECRRRRHRLYERERGRCEKRGRKVVTLDPLDPMLPARAVRCETCEGPLRFDLSARGEPTESCKTCGYTRAIPARTAPHQRRYDQDERRTEELERYFMLVNDPHAKHGIL